MAQIFLGVVVIVAGIVVLAELFWDKRRRADAARELADLRDLIGRKADAVALDGQFTAVRKGLDDEVGAIRGEVASTRDLSAADSQRIAAELHDEFERARQETQRRFSEVADGLEALRDGFNTAIGRSHHEARGRLDQVTRKLDALAQRVSQNHDRAQSELAGLKKRLVRMEQAHENQADRLADLERESWGAVRGAIDCADADVGVAVQDVLFHLAGAAGLRLVSSRVLSTAPLKARHWFAGIDEEELADWLGHAVQTRAPEVEALLEAVKTMESGLVTLGPMTLRGVLGEWRHDIRGQYAYGRA
jgi:phage-related minor tail protein